MNVIEQSRTIYSAQPHTKNNPKLSPKNSELLAALLDFMGDRLKFYLKDKGVRHDYISAVLKLRDSDNLLSTFVRAEALRDFLDTDNGKNLLSAYRRAANIVQIEERKDKISYSHSAAVDEKHLGSVEAIKLSAAIEKTGVEAESAILEKNDYASALRSLSLLRPYVDSFFERVKVNTDVALERESRLKLLSRIVWRMSRIADFSKIEG